MKNLFFKAILFASVCCAGGNLRAEEAALTVSNAVFKLGSSKDRAKITAAQDELRRAGTNAIPQLLLEIRALDKMLKSDPNGFYEKSNQVSRLTGVVFAFHTLGAAAEPAFSDLATLLNDGVLPDVTARSLVMIDSRRAATVLAHALTNQNYDVKCQAANHLSAVAANAEAALPELLQILHRDSANNDTNHLLKTFSANALGAIGQAPEKCVPALIESLHDESAYVRIAAIKALARFKSNADSALPALREISLKDTERPIRATALEAIGKIQE